VRRNQPGGRILSFLKSPKICRTWPNDDGYQEKKIELGHSIKKGGKDPPPYLYHGKSTAAKTDVRDDDAHRKGSVECLLRESI